MALLNSYMLIYFTFGNFGRGKNMTRAKKTNFPRKSDSIEPNRVFPIPLGHVDLGKTQNSLYSYIFHRDLVFFAHRHQIF